ncbi:hypothetical protein [Nonomuraea sp. SYSU D8015]|uniref:hypothetical protein n=1 Tax=Nonomuraea sp. SYSU D8015 TaxID=2593644 RepID=UPI00166011AF|nr:hypothetical protein [Nonomuraea sp. SYSU D8015]
MDVVQFETDADPSRLTAAADTISGNITHHYLIALYIRLAGRTVPGRSAAQSSTSFC